MSYRAYTFMLLFTNLKPGEQNISCIFVLIYSSTHLLTMSILSALTKETNSNEGRTLCLLVRVACVRTMKGHLRPRLEFTFALDRAC